MDTVRKIYLRSILMDLRSEIATEVLGKVREFREQNSRRRPDVGGISDVLLESSDFGSQEDVELAVIEIKSDMLGRIDQALGRLDRGVYGNCYDCGGEIVEKRLRVLPFAVRCLECEEALERAERLQGKHKRSRRHTLVDQAQFYSS